MGVKILDHCPSCGKCGPSCSTDAIQTENGKTFITQGCIDCGLCIPVCPIGLIIETNTTDFVTDAKSDNTATVVTEREEDTDGTESTSTGA